MAKLNTTNLDNSIDFFKSCKIMKQVATNSIVADTQLEEFVADGSKSVTAGALLADKVFTAAIDNVDPAVKKATALLGESTNALIKGVSALATHFKEVSEKSEYDLKCWQLQGPIEENLGNILIDISELVDVIEENIEILTSEEDPTGEFANKIVEYKKLRIKAILSYTNANILKKKFTMLCKVEREII